jgi:cell division protein FtsN
MAAKRGKTQAKRNGRKPIPGWVWGLSGLVLGAVIFGYVFMGDKWRSKLGNLPQPNPDAQAPAAANDTIAEGTPPAPDKPKMKYDFFTLLPEKEVVIPDAELAEEARAEARKSAAHPPASNASVAATNTTATTLATDSVHPAGERYLLQAGAFRGSDEADALKAQIALTGEVAHIETAQINGTTVYRVRMGPYATASSLAAAKQALAGHGISGAQAIRVK